MAVSCQRFGAESVVITGPPPPVPIAPAIRPDKTRKALLRRPALVGMQPIPALRPSVRGRGRMIRKSALGRIALLVGIVCLGCAGCQGFNFFGQAHNTPVPKEDATASAQGKPGRYQLRISPYVFL